MKHPATRSALIKVFLLVLLLSIMPLTVFIFGSQELRDPRRIMEFIDNSGFWAPLVFLLVYMLWQFLPGPASVMTAASGFLFGPIIGPLLSITGAMLAAVVEFTLARRLGFEAVQSRLPESLQELDGKFEQHTFSAIVYIRLIFIPFQIVNFSAGVSSVRFAPFFWGTLVGILPASLALPYLSGLIRMAWMQNDYSLLLDIKAALALALFFAVSAIPPLLHYRKKRCS